MARRGFAAFVLVAAAALALAPAGLATTKTSLPLTGFFDMVVDDAHGHVFVTGGSGNSSVVVVDFSGNVVTSIGSQPGAAGMALDAANSTLYVALRDSNAISVIDTATLAETSRISIAPAGLPLTVALAGGRLWFSHDCNSADSRFGSIALNGTDVQLYARSGDYPSTCPILVTSPVDDDVLVATGMGSSPPNIFVYDASTAVPTVTFWKRMSGSGDFEDLIFTPDGASLLGAAGAPYQVQRLQVSDLATSGSYPTGAYPVGVAVTSDGAYVAGAVDTGNGPEVVVFPADSSTPLRDFEYGREDDAEMYFGPLAFSADSSKLFTVAEPGTEGGGITFRVHGSPLTPPVATTTTLAASAKSGALNSKVVLTARVQGAGSGTMSIYATPYLGAKTLVAAGTVNSSGVFTRAVKLKATTTYTAEYTGDDGHLDSKSGARVVKVRPRLTVSLSGFYRKSGKYRLYHRGQDPEVVGTITPALAATKLKFVAQVYRGGRWRSGTSSTFPVGMFGQANAFLRRTTIGRYRVRVVFAGNGNHLSAVSAWAYIRITN